ncbi:uncharacterized protein LOC141691878 [Apium graveolens]|uniref:uncharacterized protein LOC141691878 n=1 Tax=Apium graveolens TaxID=4045 RepID=UPI003D79F866
MTDSSAENYDPSKDPARKAKSSDLSWKYEFWPDLSIKDQHLAGGFADITMCSKTTPAIIKEMKNYMQKHTEKSAKKNYALQLDDEGYDDELQPTENQSTDNGANFKAAGGLLCRQIPTLYWTPCAAHCIDLMMEDICKLMEFDATITHGKSLTTFVYRHGRLLAAMRVKTQGRGIVRAGAIRFATAVLTLQILYKNQDALRKLFGSTDWSNSKLAKTVAGKKVHFVVLSTKFRSSVEDCVLASIPFLQVLRVVDEDEKPTMEEFCAAMDFAKDQMKIGLENKKRLLNKVIGIIERRLESQMQVDLYGAALFLNPGN